jgi:hypothetical protein
MPRRIALPDVSTVVSNLRAIRAAASSDHVHEGRGWYAAMRGVIFAVRDEAFTYTGDFAPDALAVGVFAAFSQNATWKANVTMATNYMHGNGRGMARVLAECEAMEDGADPTDYATLGLKRADFTANLLGDESRVTCDRWHLRAAFGVDKPPTLTDDVHALVTEATRTVAAEFGETPAQAQAVIWCAVRGTGA